MNSVLNVVPRKILILFTDDGLPLNPRLSSDNISSLHGDEVKVPLEVFEREGQYYLLSGHRRLRWAISRHFKTVPVLVRPEPPTIQAKMLALVEGNNYNPFTLREKALAIRRLAEMGASYPTIACAMGEGEKTVILLNDLYDASPEVQAAVDEGRLSLSAWDKIRKESAARQVEILEQATKSAKNPDGRVTVEAVRKARADIAHEENGEPMIGDESVIEQWNAIKAKVEALNGVPVTKSDARRVQFVKQAIKSLLEGV